MIDKFSTFLDTLEKREKVILFTGTVLAVIIVGVFFITLPLYETNKKLKKQLTKEINNYYELIKLASEYSTIKPNKIVDKTISLSEIEQITQSLGIRKNITAIKPITFEGEDSIEITMKDAPASKVLSFLTEIEKRGYRIKFLSIYDPKGNRKLTVRIVLGA